MTSTADSNSPVRVAPHYVGVAGPVRGYILSKLLEKHSQLLVVVKDRSELEEVEDDLHFFNRNIRILDLPAWDTLPFEPVSPQTAISAQRLLVLDALRDSSPLVVITTPEALLQRFLPRSLTLALKFSLTPGEQYDRATVAAQLHTAGFNDVSLVEEIGEIAVRGEVIDVFPADHTMPVRIQFSGIAGGTITLRTFDPENQRSVGEPLSGPLDITPVRELIAPARWTPQQLSDALDRTAARAKELEVTPRDVGAVLEALSSGTALPGMEQLLAIAVPEWESLLGVLPSTMRVAICDQLGVQQHIDQFLESVTERYQRLSSEQQLMPLQEQLYLSAEELKTILDAKQPFTLDPLDLLETAPDQTVRINYSSNIELQTRMRSKIGSGQALAPLKLAVTRARAEDYTVGFVVGSQGRAERLQRILLEQNLDAQPYDGTPAEWLNGSRRFALAILQGHLSHGVKLPHERVLLISEVEIFGERSYRRRKVKQVSVKKLLSTLGQLADGDYVVHNDFGIGIYHGLKHMEIEGTEGDFLQIDYADSRLYLPVQNINKIQKFNASEGQQPVIDKLSSTRWLKTRQKVKEAVVTLAGDLIKLYAQRSVQKGWRFEPYGAEDDRFADSFAYNETPDQLKAITDTLNDMSNDRPMDRLVCGDVGFGKTEVALRATFKCVQHGRQVAVLVPTTILVEQHYSNFVSRFAGYDTRIGAISRFYTAQENKKTLERLASGDLDVVVGTHRLLSRDVVFKDLGLLIVDEEHRFGVQQKERLKALKKNVDVLTLTATPIPRTLHMSLLNIRDISLISTPPHDRKTIRTYVAAQSDSLVRDAIMREIQRGGQAFYLHNRVETIAGVAARLQEEIPEARFVFAHGQMSEDQLEEIMQRFLKHEADVLVSTTIIESGLDIPNANTIIIERADALGLAQLYQLRGRVGRSARQAYAYLLIPSTRNLSAEAQKRLKVLQSLDDLGLGFNLALNDLEIRGAGNLLGKEQSGAVLTVGFEQYTRILKEAIANLKGEEVPLEETIDPEVKLGINAFVPDHYIPDLSERLILYQRLGAITQSEEADDMAAEIEDRFGPAPKEVQNLVELMRLRALFRRHGVVKGEFLGGKLALSFSAQAKVDGDKVVQLLKKFPNRFKFTKNLTLSISYDLEKLNSPRDLYRFAEESLMAISTSSTATSSQSGSSNVAI